MPRTTPTQTNAAKRRATAATGPLAHVQVDAKEQGAASTLQRQVLAAYAVQESRSGKLLADIVAACRDAASRMRNNRDPDILALRQRVSDALAKPITTWGELLKAFEGTRTYVLVVSGLQKRLRIQSDAVQTHGRIIDALDSGSGASERACSIYRVHLGYSSPQMLALERLSCNFLYGPSKVLSCISLEELKLRATRVLDVSDASPQQLQPVSSSSSDSK